MTYTVSKANAQDIASSLPAEYVIENGGKAVIKNHAATGRGEFMTYRTREAAEADLGEVWNDLPAAGVHQRTEDS